jgi:nitrite reductase (NO-forming)
MLPTKARLASDRRRTISRTDDRRITFAGLATSAGLLVLAVLSLLLPESTRRGLWLPVHLVLAGAASTAIAAVLPFFTAALAVAPPAGRPTRVLAIGAVAGGALVVSGSVTAGVPAVAVGGGLTYLGGLAAVAVAGFAPLRGSLGPRRTLVTRGYAVALACVGTGVILSTSYLAALPAVVERWPLLRPAHAWLGLIGFLSLVIAATLVHLAPTVVGARMRPRTSARIAVTGTAVGAPAVAAGLALELDVVVAAGTAVTIVGALALTRHAAVVQRERGRWTTDAGWHRLTAWSLVLAPAWFVAGVGLLGIHALLAVADPAAWDLGPVAPALVVGWVVQVLVGSWSHLMPSIGPGDPVAHARQRRILGRAATARILVLQAGVGLASAGAIVGSPSLAAAGTALWATSLVASVVLFAAAARVGVSDRS